MTTTRTSSTLEDDTISGPTTEQEHPLAEAGQEAGETAGHLAERAAGVGFQQADRAREQTAEGLNQLASTVRRVSTDMESEQPAIANIASTAAEQTERIASFLRETDARQLVHSVEDVARRQPLLFLGGAFLLGVAASRFIKAAGGGSNVSRPAYGTSSYRSSSYGSTGSRAGLAAGYQATGPGGRGAEPLDDGTDEGLRP